MQIGNVERVSMVPRSSHNWLSLVSATTRVGGESWKPIFWLKIYIVPLSLNAFPKLP